MKELIRWESAKRKGDMLFIGLLNKDSIELYKSKYNIDFSVSLTKLHHRIIVNFDCDRDLFKELIDYLEGTKFILHDGIYYEIEKAIVTNYNWCNIDFRFIDTFEEMEYYYKV